MKRQVAALLALTLLMGILTGCGLFGGKEEATPTQQTEQENNQLIIEERSNINRDTIVIDRDAQTAEVIDPEPEILDKSEWPLLEIEVVREEPEEQDEEPPTVEEKKDEPEEQPQATTEPQVRAAMNVTVSNVIDGHTIEITTSSGDKQKVRLIGVESPESVSQEANRNTQAGYDAAEFTRQALNGKAVRLEFDQTERLDGQLQGYIYLNNVLFNDTLVRNGHATATPVQPNVKHQVTIQNAENEARRAGRGLWYGIWLSENAIDAPRPNATGEQQQQGPFVFLSRSNPVHSGIYHHKENCNWMENPYRVTLTQAHINAHVVCLTCQSSPLVMETQNQNQTAQQTEVTPAPPSTPNDKLVVWFAQSNPAYSGIYHTRQDCGGMVNARQGTFQQALNNAHVACNTCGHLPMTQIQDETAQVGTGQNQTGLVWVDGNQSEKLYHKEDCAVIQNATSVFALTEQNAKQEHKPCPLCFG